MKHTHEQLPDIIRYRGDESTFGLKVEHVSDVEPAYKQKMTARAKEAMEWAKAQNYAVYMPEDLRDRWANFVPIRFGDKKHAALFALFWMD